MGFALIVLPALNFNAKLSNRTFPFGYHYSLRLSRGKTSIISSVTTAWRYIGTAHRRGERLRRIRVYVLLASAFWVYLEAIGHGGREETAQQGTTQSWGTASVLACARGMAVLKIEVDSCIHMHEHTSISTYLGVFTALDSAHLPQTCARTAAIVDFVHQPRWIVSRGQCT